MANEQNQGSADSGEAAKKGGRLMPMLLALVGLAVGGTAGVMFVGPAVASDGGADSGGERPSRNSGGGHGGGDEGSSSTYAIENVIVNPAGSNGTRFLLIDLALALGGDDAEGEIEERDAEVRDLLLQLLGSRTVDELAAIGMRDELKEELRAALSSLLDHGDVVQLYFTRYVIQ